MHRTEINHSLRTFTKTTTTIDVVKIRKQVTLKAMYFIYVLFSYMTGSPILRDGVCQWWRSYVQDTAGWEIQRTRGCVRYLACSLMFRVTGI